jgi:hypothetical protein
VACFYSAAKHRSRGVLWPIFSPALIIDEAQKETSLIAWISKVSFARLIRAVPVMVYSNEQVVKVVKAELHFAAEWQTNWSTAIQHPL